MTTLRKARIKCPKCGALITVRDNGGLSPEKADRAWRAFDEGMRRLEAAMESLRRAFK